MSVNIVSELRNMADNAPARRSYITELYTRSADEIESLRARLEKAEAERDAQVKPLEWASCAWARDFERAQSPLGLYKITMLMQCEKAWSLETPNFPGEKYFDDFPSAKAAAQADYAARILSALKSKS